MIKDDPSDFPAPPPEPKQKGALAMARDEIEKALFALPFDGDNRPLVHTQIALTAAIIALVERIDRISEPLYSNRDGSIEYQIRTGGKA